MWTALWLNLMHFFFMFLRIADSGSFPKTLTAAEEREALSAMQSDDPQTAKAARQRLIEHNLRLVAHVVKKYARGDEQDDLMSIGTIGLVKAVDTFDSSKGSRLATYAGRCIENEVLMYFRAAKKTANDISINEPIDTDREGNALTLIDILPSGESVADTVDLILSTRELRKSMEERLDPREKRILSLRYGLSGRLPMPQREVALLLGISRSYVSRIEKTALEKLREGLE